MELQQFYCEKLKLAWEIYNKSGIQRNWETNIRSEEALLKQVEIITNIYDKLPNP